jgi:hypothetical protein
MEKQPKYWFGEWMRLSQDLYIQLRVSRFLCVFFFESVFVQLLKETSAVLISNKGSFVTEEA